MAQQTHEGSRRFEPVHGSMTLLAAAVLVHDKAADRIVLVQRGDRAEFGQGKWDLPVGKSEPGEPVTTTAVRELREETGLEVGPETLKIAHIVHGSRGAEAPNGCLTVVFATGEWSGVPENCEPDKHDQVCWVAADALPDEFVDSTADAVQGYLTGGSEVP